MDKIKKWFRNLSLQKAYIVYMIITLVIASLIAWGILMVITDIRYEIGLGEHKVYKTYEIKKNESLEMEDSAVYSNIKVVNLENGKYYKITIDKRMGKYTNPVYDDEGNIIAIEVIGNKSELLARIDFILAMIYMATFPVLYIVGCIYCSYLFFSNKLKKPIKILKSASHNISENNLDFNISYENEDEMGDLCNVFEKMRSALYENNKEMWDHIESRKRLNSAFAHDLRTPLTVLKGHTDILINLNNKDKLTKEELNDVLETIGNNVDRLERYTYEMSRMQKLEDIEISRSKFSIDELMDAIDESGRILSKNFKFTFINNCESKYGFGDFEIIMQAYENIIANALRYTKNKIEVVCGLKEEYLFINVRDDGKGFNYKLLKKYLEPFYKEEENVNNQNFGLGLYICKVLTEKHGGNIEINNNEDGKGASVTLVFNIEEVNR